MASETITAAAAGTWTLGDLTVNRIGLGARREEGAGAVEHEEVLAVARAHGASAAQVRVAWTLHRGAHMLAIPGTGNPDHLVDNVAAGALRLSAEELARLEAVHQRGEA